MTITNKQLSDLGDIDVTVDLYYTKGTKPAKDAKPIGTFSFTISSGRQRNLLGEPARPRRTRREVHHQGAEYLDERLVSNPCPTHHRPQVPDGYVHT